MNMYHAAPVHLGYLWWPFADPLQGVSLPIAEGLIQYCVHGSRYSVM